MGRPRRIDGAGAWHHVMNRGAGRRIVFATDSERRTFLDLLGNIDARCGVEVHSYCLVGNHFHLLLRSTDARLSEAMQWLLGNFTKWSNHRRGVDGPIFRGRFHSVPVADERHARWLVRYVHENAADAGWTGDLADYPWSSLGALIGHRVSPDWLRHDVVDWFGGRSALRDFVSGASGDVGETGVVPATRRPAPRLERYAVDRVRAAVDLVAGFVPGCSSRDREAVTIELVRRHVGADLGWLAAERGVALKSAEQSARRSARRSVEHDVCRRLVELATPLVA